MESNKVSTWQTENFSASAELIISPPLSPSPSSPSLYNDHGIGIDNNAEVAPVVDSGNNKAKSSYSTRALLATSILSRLEQEHHMDVGMTGSGRFGQGWFDPSIGENLTLFEELAEVEYTPPASPHHEAKVAVINNPSLDSNFCIVHLPKPVRSSTNNGIVNAMENPADFSALAAEFQAILDSLPKDSSESGRGPHFTEIAGIPTTFYNNIEDVVLPLELEMNLGSGIDIDFDMDVDGIRVENIKDEAASPASMVSGADVVLVDESELYGLSSSSDMSSQGSPASSIHSMYDLHDEVDGDPHHEAAERILDALLTGDVATAENYLPQISSVKDESSQESSISVVEAKPSTSVAASAGAEKKVERRGRKPGKKNAKGTAYIRDKTLRKKEQNKTAATRYRQKKKQELALILESEAALQEEHHDLEKQKDDLQRQISMVKQLLRDVMSAKKPAATKKPSAVQGAVLTASSLVIRNRRK